VLEAAIQPGGQVLTIETLENYPGWLGGKSGRELAEAMHRQALDFGAVFLPNSAETLTIRDAAGSSRRFCALLDDGTEILAKAVILALGASPRKLGIPGEEELAGAGVSYCATCDGPFFKNKKVFVVGGGDAACDNARGLSRIAAQVALVHRRGALRAQKMLADRVISTPGVSLYLNTVLRHIHGNGHVQWITMENTLTRVRTEEAADAVFIYAGLVPRNGITQKPELVEKPALDGGGFVVTGQDMATTVPGIFCAGDLRATMFRQVVVAAGEGAVAAHSAAAYIDSL
jgi:thioredoxin reductase (NADPH)